MKARQWRLFSNSFESSFTAESPSHPTQEDVKHEIAWSDSDSEDRKNSSAEVKSSDVVSEEKIPLSTQSVKQQQNQGSVSLQKIPSFFYFPSLVMWLSSTKCLFLRRTSMNLTQTMNHLQNNLITRYTAVLF